VRELITGLWSWMRTPSRRRSALPRPAVPALHGYYDECMKGEAQVSPGFMKASPSVPLGRPGSCGLPGAGGSTGFADPQGGIGYGYVTNRMGTTLSGDPRDVALRDAIYSVAGLS